MKKQNKLLTLFLSVFKLSACTFGGGFVIVPLMRKRFVEELHWIDEQEMLDMVAIAQSSPGPIAVNASILVGYHVAGGLGALLAAMGTVLPPLVIISVLSLFYLAFRDHPVVNLVMAGMMCGVAAVILDVVISMAMTVVKQKRLLPVVMLVCALLAVRLWQVNILVVLLVCGAVGAADTLHRERRRA